MIAGSRALLLRKMFLDEDKDIYRQSETSRPDRAKLADSTAGLFRDPAFYTMNRLLYPNCNSYKPTLLRHSTKPSHSKSRFFPPLFIEGNQYDSGHQPSFKLGRVRCRSLTYPMKPKATIIAESRPTFSAIVNYIVT